jgi:GNAT superfamily N-acetyltransferase
VATPADADLVTRLLVEAFDNDPMWGAWAFPTVSSRRANRQAVFRIFVDGALRYPATWIASGTSAVTVWIPPGKADLTAVQEEQLEQLFRDRLGPRQAERVLESLDRLVAMEPKEPHYYLSLFGTHPRYAGHGYGKALLAYNLEQIDRQGVAAYLDCADELVPFYSRFGFEVIGSVTLADGPRSNGMWRSAHPMDG